MRPLRPLEIVYLLLAILGTLLPLSAFLPWLAVNGLAIPLFLTDLFANRISAFFAWDVIVSAVAVLVAAAVARRRLTTVQLTGIVGGTLIVGVSLGLPLLLLCLERSRKDRREAPDQHPAGSHAVVSHPK
jgi:hypothetical protein